jgi:hypothetical protein
VALLPQRQSNSRRKDSLARDFVKQAMRKRVETCFSAMEAAFLKAIHAVTPLKFLLKIVLFLFAYTIDKCL